MHPGVRVIVSALFLALVGCGGGGGGGGGGSTTTPPTSTGPTWTPGVFQPASTFQDFCAAVRTGRDIEGNLFPDKAGTLLQELFFLRSWTNQTYLWNTEVVDQNPASFSNRLTYFNALKTTATTASGKPKDQFHFAMLTADYLAQTISAPTASYGAEFKIFSGTPPRDTRVIYTQPGTPATELLAGTPKLSRGARIMAIDGVDLVNGGSSQVQIDAFNAALFPTAAGVSHTFQVQYPDNSLRSITLTSANIVETPVNRTSVFIPSGGAAKVGYMLLNTFSPFSSEKAISDAITSFKTQGVSDLVVDLRYNGGGLLAVASQLGYQIAGAARTAGRNFDSLQFNAAAGNRDPVTGAINTPTPFYTTGLGFSLTTGTALQSLNLSRVYILSTANTCSASEAVINGLRGVNVDVVLVGGTTCGKPYGFYPQDNCGETYFSIQFKGVNDMGFGDYADGFAAANSLATAPVKITGCAVLDDDLSHDLGDTSEAMLAAALNYRATATCPPPPTTGLSVASVRPDDAKTIASTGRSDAAQARDFLRNNLDMRMPKQAAP